MVVISYDIWHGNGVGLILKKKIEVNKKEKYKQEKKKLQEVKRSK